MQRIRNFQFHKGAIETGSGISAIGNAFGFQFHKGAIETLRVIPILLAVSLSIP